LTGGLGLAPGEGGGTGRQVVKSYPSALIIGWKSESVDYSWEFFLGL
jgi:hypothetical protein